MDKKFGFVVFLQRSLWSSFLILFAGIVLGSLMLPVDLDKQTQIVIIILAMVLFFYGVSIQTIRERKIEKETSQKICELNDRLTKLENRDTSI